VFRVRKDGHYKHGSKITVLFGIEPGDPNLPPHARGSLQNPRRWVRCIRSRGTSTVMFRDFCDYICSDIENNGYNGTDDHRILMWDNLLAHHVPVLGGSLLLPVLSTIRSMHPLNTRYVM